MAELNPQAEADKLAEKVELLIDGKIYAAWTEVSVTLSLEGLSGQFSLTLADTAETGGASFAGKPGDRCELRLGGEPVINGWIDAVEPQIAGEDHSITVSGRDRTADLADCSAIHKPGSWRNVRLEAIAAALLKPFGLSVTVTAKGGTGKPIARFAIQPGETVHAALERLLRFRGLLMVADAQGNLEIITPAEDAPIATLELGVNILSASAAHDHRERFSEYVVKGQASGSNAHHGKVVSQIRASATDAEVLRHRPMLVIAEDQSNLALAKARAKWEAGVRAGRAHKGDITTLGWRTAAGGKIWRPNVRAQVKCAPIGFADETMLVSTVAFTKGAGGTMATITVMPPGAWQQLAEPEKPEKARKRT